jgi:hypothetical protein
LKQEQGFSSEDGREEEGKKLPTGKNVYPKGANKREFK